MKTFQKILVGLAVAFVLIQLVPVDRSNPPLAQEVPASPAVLDVIRRACYDCHSNATRWPWYSYVAPASWLVVHHVDEGRHEVNFTDWAQYPPDKAAKKIYEVGEEVEEGAMPMPGYLLLHGEARLSDADKKLLVDWSKEAGRKGD